MALLEISNVLVLFIIFFFFSLFVIPIITLMLGQTLDLNIPTQFTIFKTLATWLKENVWVIVLIFLGILVFAFLTYANPTIINK